nr:hypothetical protein [Tanacetum cinerariifolium]
MAGKRRKNGACVWRETLCLAQCFEKDDRGGLSARVKSLEEKERRSVEPNQEDAPITWEIKEIGEELGADKSTELGSNDTEEMVNVRTAGVPTVSGSFPTVSAIFTTASLIDAQVAREMEKEFTRENQRLSEQLARDSKIARLHAKEELKIMIEGLDKSNEVIAKHLRKYEQAAADLSVGEKLELIRMTLEQTKEKFIPVWKQYEDFIPTSSKEESERVKRQGLKIDQGSSKRMKTSKSVSEDVKHLIIDWEIHSEGKREYWRIIILGGHTAVYQFFVDMLKQFDREDLHQL